MSIRIRDNLKVPPEEAEAAAEGEGEKKQQLARLLDSRTIDSLPIHWGANYSPHFNLEFDVLVQDYCRHQTNLMKLNKCIESTANQKSQQLLNKIKRTPGKKAAQAPAAGGLIMPPTSASSNIVRSSKVVVSGDVAVGKTCLVNRFGHAVYSSTYQTTIGVDFDLQRFNVLGQPYVLQIWDTAGLERFKCITSSYYRGCQVALIVFDMANMSSLASVVKWRDEILAAWKTYDQLASELDASKQPAQTKQAYNNNSNNNNDEAPLLFLVGTKCDLPITESARAFMSEQANRMAASLNAELWFVSAQTGENVNELFNRIAALSFNRRILAEVRQMRFDASTMGACLKEQLLQQQRELWNQSSKLIKITRKKDGDERRTRCVNVQCVIK